MAYGLYHGLILFPVVLSLIGPAPFPVAAPTEGEAIWSEELEPQLPPVVKPNDHLSDDEATELETRKINAVTSLSLFSISSF